MGEPTRISRAIWQTIKWAVFGLVLGFVVWHAWTLWNRLESVPTHVHWGWLVVVAFGTVAAWFPSVWYWRWMMAQLGAKAPWPQVLRSYFCGGLGKYLPGKAAVIVLRSAFLKPVDVPPATAGLAVTYETLTCMWAGGLSIILLYPSLAAHLPEWLDVPAHHPVARYAFFFGNVVVGAGILAALLRSHRLLRGIGQKRDQASATAADVVEAVAQNHDGEPEHPSLVRALRLTLTGGAVFLAGWWLHGLTLGLTILAVIGDRIDWADWPFWTGAAAVSLVGGFIVLFAPGGLGVREGLLLELLERQLGPREAVLVTVLWRAASLVGELVVSGALYYWIPGLPAAKQQPPVRE